LLLQLKLEIHKNDNDFKEWINTEVVKGKSVLRVFREGAHDEDATIPAWTPLIGDKTNGPVGWTGGWLHHFMTLVQTLRTCDDGYAGTRDDVRANEIRTVRHFYFGLTKSKNFIDKKICASIT
jgi:hypothetical protein